MNNKDLLKSVYNDFFGKETTSEIIKGSEDLLKQGDLLNKEIEHLEAAERDLKNTAAALNAEMFNDIGSTEINDTVSLAPDTATETEVKAEEKTAEKSEKDPMEELNELVGLDKLKKDVEELINLMKLQKMREERGMKSVDISKHLVFSGNPGTGKTTVARILAKLYKQAGILSKGQLVEVDRSGLVAGYVGQTAIKTAEKIQEAMGGILFIDEAYALVKEGQDYGQEAIDTILKAMEDNREDFVVIVAGYPDLMETFINSNPGLRSRFNKYFFFEDYSAEELKKIFDIYLKKNDYTLSDEARVIVEKHLEDMVKNKDSNFANAREVRNYFEKIVNRQASRAVNITDATNEELGLITPDDLKFSDDVFKWAFIGTGTLANFVGDELMGSEKHDITAVYSHTPEKCKAFADKYQATAYSSAEEAMKAPDVDGVYIVTPHNSHYEYAKLALELKKPVLLEKPFTVKAAETKEIFELAKKQDVYIAEAMWTWFADVANYVKFWYDCGLFGKITKVHVDYRCDGRNYAARVTDPLKAGGAILDIGVYALTYLYRIFGKPETMVCNGKLANGIDEGEEITLTFKNDITATCSICCVEPEFKEQVIIEGTNASVVVPDFHYANEVTLKRVGEDDITVKADGSYLNEFTRVAAEIRSGLKESAYVPPKATIEVMELIDECRRQMDLVYPFEK
ncbi:MAG: Gfo/Idh/MocA family oxidoreductase [Lachnospiraceae bacterium]|nr:Gfo/Idh/MocA family oxidoreductase [Lachnospiraceae bacterium]